MLYDKLYGQGFNYPFRLLRLRSRTVSIFSDTFNGHTDTSVIIKTDDNDVLLTVKPGGARI
ncbi:MAG TPA: hypothetical protein VGN90_08605 [Pyrinomonadaceae bacterium]|jgi:hypothetical protein|nr:hypothetical protein [Pyrinomonadaceae bacterium]